jgi:YesN/AraC family two-component response regulator
MEKQEKIPVLKPEELSDFHHKNIDWNVVITHTKHQYFHINRLEDNIHKFTLPLPPHRKTLHDFIYLKKGCSKRSKGLNRYHFEAAELFFLPAYQITEHEAMSIDSEGVYVHFDEKIFDFLPKNYLNDTYYFFNLQANPVVALTESAQKNIENIIERLLDLYENNDEKETNLQLISTYLLVLFEEIKHVKITEKKKTKNAYFQVTEQYKNALSQHIYQKQNVTDFANLLSISPNYLNKCVKSSINVTAQELLNEMLVLEAKTLLKYSNLQISEIAVSLFDQTPSNFSRFFKKQTGITPKQYLELY